MAQNQTLANLLMRFSVWEGILNTNRVLNEEEDVSEAILRHQSVPKRSEYQQYRNRNAAVQFKRTFH